MKSTTLELAKMIREAREKKGLTQWELAHKLGYESMQFVSLMERGLSKVPRDKMKQLIEVLDLNKNKIKLLLMSSFKEQLNQDLGIGA
jgi:cyanate lyase